MGIMGWDGSRGERRKGLVVLEICDRTEESRDDGCPPMEKGGETHAKEEKLLFAKLELFALFIFDGEDIGLFQGEGFVGRVEITA